MIIYVHKFISKFLNIPTKYLIELGLGAYVSHHGTFNMCAKVAFRYSVMCEDVDSIAKFYGLSRERVGQILRKIARYA